MITGQAEAGKEKEDQDVKDVEKDKKKARKSGPSRWHKARRAN